MVQTAGDYTLVPSQKIDLNGATGQTFKDRILALVYEQMANFGDDYQSAWNTVKRRFPALFGENFNLK